MLVLTLMLEPYTPEQMFLDGCTTSIRFVLRLNISQTVLCLSASLLQQFCKLSNKNTRQFQKIFLGFYRSKTMDWNKIYSKPRRINKTIIDFNICFRQAVSISSFICNWCEVESTWVWENPENPNDIGTTSLSDDVTQSLFWCRKGPFLSWRPKYSVY